MDALIIVLGGIGYGLMFVGLWYLDRDRERAHLRADAALADLSRVRARHAETLAQLDGLGRALNPFDPHTLGRAFHEAIPRLRRAAWNSLRPSEQDAHIARARQFLVNLGVGEETR